MRGLFLGGLGLFLGCLVATTNADELKVKWRPAGSKAARAKNTSTTSKSNYQPAPNNSGGSFFRIGKPVPVNVPEISVDSNVRPASFRSAVNQPPLPTFRAQEDSPQPMPSGPDLDEEETPLPPPRPREKVEKVEIGPLPRPFLKGRLKRRILTKSGPSYETIVDPDWGTEEGEYCEDGCCEETCWSRCFSGWGTGWGYCCALPRFYASGEYLLWGIQEDTIPPLVTTNNFGVAETAALASLFPTFRPGGIGQIGTQVLVDDNSFDSPIFSGGRFTIGFGGPRRQLGFETTYFFLGEENESVSFASMGSPSLFRPFFNVNDGIQDAQLVAFPTLLAGNVTVSRDSRLWGIEANFRKPWYCGCWCSIDLLAGFRFLELNENLTISESVTFLRGGLPPPLAGVSPGDNISVVDSFGTRNRFYGGQIGADFECRKGRWIFGLLTKIGLGSMQQTVNISGFSTFTPLQRPQVVRQGGLLAQQSNIGRVQRDEFAVIPEVSLKLGYQITDHLSAYVAYNFLYVSSVVRPGQQIDLGVNPNQLPSENADGGNLGDGPARPVLVFRDSGFWAQGVNFGLKWEY